MKKQSYRRPLIFAALLLLAPACRRGEPFTLPQPPSGGGATAEVEKNSYADVVGRVAPAVVTIRSSRVSRAPQQHPFMDDPFFRDFFGERPQQQQPRSQRQEGLGSGVIISQDGYIVTNHHVVDGAEEIKVELTDRRAFDAKLVGSDQPSDLAVLKIDSKDSPVLTLGDSDKVRVGDIVLAVGNPLGVGQTVTSGIISAKGRRTGLSDGSFEDFLQTDAAINRGNSGGALVNTHGELIGINSQIVSPSGGNIGIGFAIPSNMARTVVEQLINGGKVRRGQLGVGVQAVTAEIAQSMGLRDARGVIVSSVQRGSAADRAGVKPNDVIVAFNGHEVGDPNELRNLVAATQPGTEVTLTLNRDGRQEEVKLSLGELVAAGAGREREEQGGGDEGEGGGGRLGLAVSPLTPELAARLRLPEGSEGVVVTAGEPDGPAAEARLQQGDLIVQANRQPVRTPDELRAAVRGSGDRPVLLLVTRPGEGTIFVTVRPRK
ncbi:MAG TPA: DegQ family serine endoprotease [Pyrinomonadaceae bacterium]|nr:DegQ family serine endoprotease [Pyrinomonadaceae bacterium]